MEENGWGRGDWWFQLGVVGSEGRDEQQLLRLEKKRNTVSFGKGRMAKLWHEKKLKQ